MVYRYFAKVGITTILVFALTIGILLAPKAYADPTFKAPWTCGVTWHASTYEDHGNAVDFNNLADYSDAGAPVLASAAGTATVDYQVYTSGPNTGTGWGNYVLIDHGGGWKTRYAHLASAPSITDRNSGVGGIQVNTGDVIGTVGSSGADGDVHLHYEQISSSGMESVAFDGVVIEVGDYSLPGVPTHTSTNCDSQVANGSNLMGIMGANTAQSGDNILVRRQLDTNGNWGLWTQLSGHFGEVDMATMSDGRIGIVALDTSAPAGTNNVYVRKQLDTNGNWESAWTALSGHLTKASASYDSSNRMTIAGLTIGSGDNVVVRKQVDSNGNWQSSWTGLSGHFGEIDLASAADGRAYLVALNTDAAIGTNNVFIRKQVDSNGNWQSSWGGLTGYLNKVSATMYGSDLMAIAGVNTTVTGDNVYYRKQADTAGNWHAWVGLSGHYNDIDMTSLSGKLALAAINTDVPVGSNNIYIRKQLDANNWQSAWTGLSGYVTSITAGHL